MNQIDHFKAQFSERKGTHFNNAGLAPLSKKTAHRILEMTQDQLFFGSGAIEKLWMPTILRSKNTLATFLGSKPEQIAWTMNCAHGLSQAALGFPLTAKDAIVTIDQEYASNFYPWREASQRTGAKLIVVESDPNFQISIDRLLKAVEKGVKLVGISWVQFQTGSLVDLIRLGERCHKIGAYLIVDGAQGLGQLPFSFDDLPIDMVVGLSHKWMCSSVGQGFMAIKSKFMECLNPLMVGARTYNRMGLSADLATPIESSAGRFDCGSTGLAPLFGLESATELLLETGVENIASEIHSLSCVLREKLLSLEIPMLTPIDQAGGITTFSLNPDVGDKLFNSCKEENVNLTRRGLHFRVSMHAFNNPSEIDQFCRLLQLARQTS